MIQVAGFRVASPVPRAAEATLSAGRGIRVLRQQMGQQDLDTGLLVEEEARVADGGRVDPDRGPVARSAFERDLVGVVILAEV